MKCKIIKFLKCVLLYKWLDFSWLAKKKKCRCLRSADVTQSRFCALRKFYNFKKKKTLRTFLVLQTIFKAADEIMK